MLSEYLFKILIFYSFSFQNFFYCLHSRYIFLICDIGTIVTVELHLKSHLPSRKHSIHVSNDDNNNISNIILILLERYNFLVHALKFWLFPPKPIINVRRLLTLFVRTAFNFKKVFIWPRWAECLMYKWGTLCFKVKVCECGLLFHGAFSISQQINMINKEMSEVKQKHSTHKRAALHRGTSVICSHYNSQVGKSTFRENTSSASMGYES